MTTTRDTTSQNPIATVCEALGVPEQDWHLFSRWAQGPFTSQACDELHQYVDVMIADRCRKPGCDLVSQLIAMEVDGEGLTTDDIRSYVVSLVADVA
jgi:cytochrome P450